MYTYNLGQKFEEIAEKYESKKAIIFEKNSAISFTDLNKLANQIANYFVKLNIEKGDVIAIQNSKTVLGFAGMLACLKIGAIYTNFDYTNPSERINKILLTAKPKLVFTDIFDTEIEKLCNNISLIYLNVGNMENYKNISCQSDHLDSSLLKQVSSNSPAYIMFTSGSTGIPKGVLVNHRSILNFIVWAKDIYQLQDNDIMTNINPIYFDNSVFDFYCSIFNGITMVAIPKRVVDKPKEMVSLIDEIGCTFWFSVPSMLVYLTNLKLLSKEVLQKVRIFAFGGEGYPKELLRKLYKIYMKTAQFYNVYGPTEGTCICSAYRITEKDMEEEGLAPLGDIAYNFEYSILNEKNMECDFGELCLMGEQLAIGYYNDIERTKKSFVQYPNCRDYEIKMYRTGDLVERVDNKLYFRGRVDNQIKHMGYRIELEEIENAIIRIKGIKECAVVHTLSKNSLSKIIAFVVMDEKKDYSELRKELKKYLPTYMMPQDFKYMDVLPKNANGKIDRILLKEKVKNI